MFRIRWELQAQRGGHQQVFEALESAIRSGNFPLPSARVSASRFGTLYRFTIEWEVENYAALDAFNDALKTKTKELDPLWQEIHPYLETGDTATIWEAIA